MGLIDAIFGKRTFFLRNKDTGQELQGQFPAQNVVENKSSNYSETVSLNMQTPISQFVNGELDTISFQATFFNRDIVFGQAGDDIDLLDSWIERDNSLTRPPILSFSIGDGHLSMGSCTLRRLSKRFMMPYKTGKLKGVVCDITLAKYKGYSLESEEPGETRYHIAKTRDYFEMLTYNEYGSAEMGDIIRQRHPDKLNIQVADVIKLPSVEAIRTEVITQKSNVFKTAYGKKETEQRSLRISMLERRDDDYTSYII
jgi:hypothetical protein